MSNKKKQLAEEVGYHQKELVVVAAVLPMLLFFSMCSLLGYFQLSKVVYYRKFEGASPLQK